jgi:DNA-binding beta-propeller fold protein YncE
MTKGGMMKKVLGLFFLVAFLGSMAWAGPWGIVVNTTSKNISTIDLGQSPPKVYGPFLTGSLGTTTDSLLDVAVTPDSNYALVSNFYEHKVYRIDISDPTNPGLAGSLTLGSFYPEDISISPNGQFAVISDGSSNRELAFISLPSFSNYSLYTLTSSNLYAQAVAIGNDNSTIIICDYYTKRIVYGRVNASLTGLVSESNYPSDGWPINITISPDGATVLIANFDGNLVGVYQITGPGVVVPGSTTKVTGFHDGPQSIVFSPDGKKAYVNCGNYSGNLNTLTWLQVNSPGNVTMGGERVANLNSYSNGGYFGVDTLAVSPAGNYAIAGNTSSNIDSRNRVSLINLSNYQVTAIDATLSDAKGVAVFNEQVFAPTSPSLERKTNNYIFYKEYINILSWQANSKNKFPISKYRIYRKAKDAADSAYQQLTEVDASIFQYTERGLKKTDYYTYRITSINSRGLESVPIEVSNTVVMGRAK